MGTILMNYCVQLMDVSFEGVKWILVKEEQKELPLMFMVLNRYNRISRANPMAGLCMNMVDWVFIIKSIVLEHHWILNTLHFSKYFCNSSDFFLSLSCIDIVDYKIMLVISVDPDGVTFNHSIGSLSGVS